MADKEATAPMGETELGEAPLGEDGMLSPAALDALLAAAQSEEGLDTSGWGASPEVEADILPEADAFPSAGAEETAEAAVPGSNSVGSGAVSLPSFDAPAAPSGGPGGSGMTRVRDIPLEVTVELGRTRLLIKDILDLGAGSIIELDKLAGEPVDLFANGLLVARGEVIVIDDNFGVRVTEIITAADRDHMKEANALAA